MSSLLVPVPLLSTPSPHAPSLFLGAPSCPFPSAERCKSGEMNVTRASEPLINIAISAAETVHSEVGTVLPRPPASPRERSARSPSLCTGNPGAAQWAVQARSCLGSGNAILAPGV